jgi:hypothetical protein
MQMTARMLANGMILAQIPKERPSFLHAALHFADSFGDTFLHTPEMYCRHFTPLGFFVVLGAAVVVDFERDVPELVEDLAEEMLGETDELVDGLPVVAVCDTEELVG